MPLFARKFIVDFAETALGLIFALELVFPTTVAESQQVVVTIGGAALAAAISAARRAAPGFLAYLSGALGVDRDGDST
jgi:hypothetical protein